MDGSGRHPRHRQRRKPGSAWRRVGHLGDQAAEHNGYACASSASGGGGASRVPRIAGGVTAGPAPVGCVLVSSAPRAERRRL